MNFAFVSLIVFVIHAHAVELTTAEKWSCVDAMAASAEAPNFLADAINEHALWTVGNSTRDLLPRMLASLQIVAPKDLALRLEDDGVLRDIFSTLYKHDGNLKGKRPAYDDLLPSDGREIVASTLGRSISEPVLERFLRAYLEFAAQNGLTTNKRIFKRHLERFANAITESVEVHVPVEISSRIVIKRQKFLANVLRRLYPHALHTGSFGRRLIAYHPDIDGPTRIDFDEFRSGDSVSLHVRKVARAEIEECDNFFRALADQIELPDVRIFSFNDRLISFDRTRKFGSFHIRSDDRLKMYFQNELTLDHLADLGRAAFGRRLDYGLRVYRGWGAYELTFKPHRNLYLKAAKPSWYMGKPTSLFATGSP